MKAPPIPQATRPRRGLKTCLALLVLCQSMMAADLYVAPGGRDTNPGTRQKPLGTLEAARDAIRKQIAGGMKEDINQLVVLGTAKDVISIKGRSMEQIAGNLVFDGLYLIGSDFAPEWKKGDSYASNWASCPKATIS